MSTYELELHDGVAGSVIVSLAGELDLTNARELEERLNEAATQDVPLVVDINQVVFLDSAALHVFFRLARQRTDGSLALVMAPDAAVSRTLEIVSMSDAVRVVPSLAELDATDSD